LRSIIHKREADMHRNLEAKLDILEAQDVTIVDRRQTYLDEAVDVNRICRGRCAVSWHPSCWCADVCWSWGESR
jgi:hypothetical protein